jgi:outer membrane protein
MKRFVSIATLGLAIALAAALQAQEPAAAPAPTGVVTVTFSAAVLQTAEAQRELGALQTKYAPRQAQIKALNDQVVELQKQLQATGDKLSDAERASREQTLNSKEKQLQRDSEDYKTDTQSDQQQVFQGVAQKLFAFLQTYAKQQGYTLVVERGSDASPVVWYSAGNLDITDALVKAYNAQSGVAAPAPAARPGTARTAPASPPKPQSAAPAPK